MDSAICPSNNWGLVVNCPETKGDFRLEEKTNLKAVCGLGRTNYGGLQNALVHPIIDPLLTVS